MLVVMQLLVVQLLLVQLLVVHAGGAAAAKPGAI